MYIMCPANNITGINITNDIIVTIINAIKNTIRLIIYIKVNMNITKINNKLNATKHRFNRLLSLDLHFIIEALFYYLCCRLSLHYFHLSENQYRLVFVCDIL